VLLVSFEFPYLRLSLFPQCLFWGGTDAPVLPLVLSWVREMESVALVASVRGDAGGLIRKVAVLEGEPAEAHRAWEEVEESAHSLSSSSAEGARWLVAFETEHQE
jgi:hypothetical protein